MNTLKNIETTHKVAYIRFIDDYLIISVDGKEYKIIIDAASPKLAQATEVERNDFEISPGGYGIHWRLLDEDLSINGLIRDALNE